MNTTSSPATAERARESARSSVPSKPAAWRCYPGGASHVIALAGADCALDDITVPLGYAGVSAGALVAIARAFDVSHAKLQAVLERLLVSDRVLDYAPFELGDGGICGWRVIPEAIDALLGPGATMGQAKHPLVVVVTDLDKGEPVYIDSRNAAHKEILVREVARATSAIPGVAPQVPIASWKLGLYTPGVTLYSDGGVTDNTADHVFDDEEAPRVALRLYADPPVSRVRYGQPVRQAFAVFKAILFAASRIKSRRRDGVVVDVPALGSGFDFSLTVDEQRARWRVGHDAVKARANDLRALKRAV